MEAAPVFGGALMRRDRESGARVWWRTRDWWRARVYGARVYWRALGFDGWAGV